MFLSKNLKIFRQNCDRLTAGKRPVWNRQNPISSKNFAPSHPGVFGVRLLPLFDAIEPLRIGDGGIHQNGYCSDAR
jgi:hypothetical protein